MQGKYRELQGNNGGSQVLPSCIPRSGEAYHNIGVFGILYGIDLIVSHLG